jgi:hypothetical protein
MIEGPEPSREQRTLALALARLPRRSRDSVPTGGWMVPVLIRLSPGVESNTLGVRTFSRFGDTVTAEAQINELDGLSRRQGVVRLYPPRLVSREPIARMPELVPLGTSLDPRSQDAEAGRGVLIGIVDMSPIDFSRREFWRLSSSGDWTPRILRLWDQTLMPQGSEVGPSADGLFGTGGRYYGVEYLASQIQAACSRPGMVPDYGIVRHPPFPSTHDYVNHANRVAARAAKMAPGADLLIVRLRPFDPMVPNADTPAVLDACAYLFATADRLGLPCVVNLSLGDDQGPHDGTLEGEQCLDWILRGGARTERTGAAAAGRVIVVSAGNMNDGGHHAAHRVTSGQPVELGVTWRGSCPDTIEIWYDGMDRFSATVRLDGQLLLGPILPDSERHVLIGDEVELLVSSQLDDPESGDNHIAVVVRHQKGRPASIPEGRWLIVLEAVRPVTSGWFHAWIDRNNRGSSFTHPLYPDRVTVSSPGTTRRVITVGAGWIEAGDAVVDGHSARGPTRDARLKPELIADGWVRKEGGSGGDVATSYAAPIAAGVCAQLLSIDASLTCAKVKQILLDERLDTRIRPHGVVADQNKKAVFEHDLPNLGFGYLRDDVEQHPRTPPEDAVDVWIRRWEGDLGNDDGGRIDGQSPDIRVRAGTQLGDGVPAERVVEVTVRNRGSRTARNVEVYLYWSAGRPGRLEQQVRGATDGILVRDFRLEGQTDTWGQGNKQVIRQLHAGAGAMLLFGWIPSDAGPWCLVARVEHELDTSPAGDDRRLLLDETMITSSNNIALVDISAR